MTILSPLEAAGLAAGIYALNSERELKLFLATPLLSSESKNVSVMQAEVGTRLINTKDAFAVCASGGVNHSNDLFLIFRGTTGANYGADIFTDARIGIERDEFGLPVHCGFNHAFESMLPELEKFLSNHRNTTGTIHCIGHSLGGAVATLAANWVAHRKINNVKLYTFGSPRVGTDWFVRNVSAKIKAKNIHRVYHTSDPVTMVPLYPFMHVPSYGAEGYHLESSLGVSSHFIRNYVNSVRSHSWDSIHQPAIAPNTLEASIERWLKSKTPVDASSAKFWQWVDSALVYVVKKAFVGAALVLQGAFIGALTIADKIAYILAKGIEIGETVSVWVYHLMRKLMQALGMKIVKDVNDLTRALMRTVLARIVHRMAKDAQNAIRRLTE